jgi:Chitin binding Peritrophin-A domain
MRKRVQVHWDCMPWTVCNHQVHLCLIWSWQSIFCRVLEWVYSVYVQVFGWFGVQRSNIGVCYEVNYRGSNGDNQCNKRINNGGKYIYIWLSIGWTFPRFVYRNLLDWISKLGINIFIFWLSKAASNCRIYYDCAVFHAPVLVQCPVGTQYDAKKELCESESKCIEIVCPERSETGGGVSFVSYDHDSQFYVECSNEYTLYAHKCPNDLVFNEVLAMCVPRTTTVDSSTTSTTTATKESTTVGFTTKRYVCPSDGLSPGLYIESYWIGLVKKVFVFCIFVYL